MAGIFKYEGEVLPMIKEVLAIPGVEQWLADHESGGGGFSNAGVLTALHTHTHTHMHTTAFEFSCSTLLVTGLHLREMTSHAAALAPSRLTRRPSPDCTTPQVLPVVPTARRRAW